MLIALSTPAFATKNWNEHQIIHKCEGRAVGDEVNFAWIRGQPNLQGTPLWKLTSGTVMYWIEFKSTQEPWPHGGWISSRIIAPEAVAQSNTPPTAPAQSQQPAPPPPPIEAPPPEHRQVREQPASPPVPNNYNFNVPGEPPFDRSACLVTPKLSNAYPVYAQQDADSTPVANINPGDIVCVLSTGEWSHIHFKRGQTFDGWVRGLEIQSTATPY